MSVTEMKLQYPQHVEFFMKMGEMRAINRAYAQKREARKKAKQRLWPIIPSNPKDRW